MTQTTTGGSGGRLLLSAITWNAAGHLVIALQIADSFRAANPDLHIGLIVPDIYEELARLLPGIQEVFPVGVAATRPLDTGTLAGVPRDWDYVVTAYDTRGTTPTLEAFGAELRAHVRGAVFGPETEPGMPAHRVRPLRLQLPEAARQAAAGRVDGARTSFIVIPGSGTGNGSRTPSPGFWSAVVGGLLAREERPQVVLIGLSRQSLKGVTKHFGREQVAAIRAGREADVVDGFDLPMLEQLALAERGSVLIAPHTGFAFAIQALGVPWVALSGYEFHEYWMNGVPFISLYPDCPRYPCSGRRLEVCDDLAGGEFRDRFPCMSDAELVPRIPRILAAADELAAGRLTYQSAVDRHLAYLTTLGMGIRKPVASRAADYRF